MENRFVIFKHKITFEGLKELIVHTLKKVTMNNLRHLFSFLFLFFFSLSSFAQIKEATTIPFSDFQLNSRLPINYHFISSTGFRHNSFRYLPTKFKNEHVISVAQPNTMFDNVYYLDAKGNTMYRSMAVTAPINMMNFNDSQRRDSFNPNGMLDLRDGILQGLANFVFCGLKNQQ